MENPFDDLISEEERKRRYEAAKLQERRQVIQGLFPKYNEMVVKVLEQLRASVYSAWEVRSTNDDTWSHWSIGRESAWYGRGTGVKHSTWDDKLIVSLSLDNNNNPYFSCYSLLYKIDGNTQIISCPPIEDKLIETLKELHQNYLASSK
jgi:hypothetical protein